MKLKNPLTSSNVLHLKTERMASLTSLTAGGRIGLGQQDSKCYANIHFIYLLNLHAANITIKSDSGKHTFLLGQELGNCASTCLSFFLCLFISDPVPVENFHIVTTIAQSRAYMNYE